MGALLKGSEARCESTKAMIRIIGTDFLGKVIHADLAFGRVAQIFVVALTRCQGEHVSVPIDSIIILEAYKIDGDEDMDQQGRVQEKASARQAELAHLVPIQAIHPPVDVTAIETKQMVECTIFQHHHHHVPNRRGVLRKMGRTQ